MPYLALNDINLYYEFHGEGTPLLLIAGLASDSQSWQPIIEDLSQNFLLITPDNRGTGRTQPQDEVTEFASVTKADNIRFHSLTYQELMMDFTLASGGKTYREISKALNDHDYMTAGNQGSRPFTKDTVRGIIQNRFYLISCLANQKTQILSELDSLEHCDKSASLLLLFPSVS